MEEFKLSFTGNFIEDNRYMYLLEGLKNTLIITLLAVVLGITLGFVVAMIRSTSDKTGKLKFLNWLCKLYLTIFRGTPVMIQLLIMFYIVFNAYDKFLRLQC